MTYVGSVVVPASDDCVTRRKAEVLQRRVGVAVGVGSRSRASFLEGSRRDMTGNGQGGEESSDGELHCWRVGGGRIKVGGRRG